MSEELEDRVKGLLLTAKLYDDINGKYYAVSPEALMKVAVMFDEEWVRHLFPSTPEKMRSYGRFVD